MGIRRRPESLRGSGGQSTTALAASGRCEEIRPPWTGSVVRTWSVGSSIGGDRSD